ncbi:hypothetical protein F9K33_00140 [bacterium]|nr:MAG: hypothetical protein F9K33_00140 [bacterium]
MKSLFFIVFVVLAAKCDAQTSQEFFQSKYREGVKAYESKDYFAFIRAMQSADSVRPNTYSILYNIAGGQALTGQSDASLKSLAKAVWINVSKQFMNDSDFVSIWNTPGMKDIFTLIDSINKPISLTETAFTMEDNGFHPEGIAYDAKTKRFFIGSIRQRTIAVRDEKGTVNTSFFKKTDRLFCVMGMKVDSKRRALWVATSVMPEMTGYADSLQGKAAVARFNIDSGDLEKIYSIAGEHVFGDLAIHPSGDVYISDSGEPSLYKISSKDDQLKLWLTFPTAWNLQGLDFSSDGNTLFVADYISGLYCVSLKTQTIDKIGFDTPNALRGIDGLYFYKNSLLALQNGTNPLRACRYYLNNDQTRITKMEFVEKATDNLGEPTLGVVSGDTFYFIANSPWGAYDRKHQFDASKAQKPVVRKYEMGR